MNNGLDDTTNHTYDLRGRLQQSQRLVGSQRDTTTFEYGDNGIRVSAQQVVENNDGYGNWNVASEQRTTYLNDPFNFTGYSQVLVETVETAFGVL
ncbi:hypothetical protein NA78x_001441 [Anatilimnocola sp. NA78]|uniref:hypothetical protein n=1 Tax=Anatilimnocola sp. NA78 TaxID=3415683 RepID=UPI003CE51B6D